MSNTLLQSSDAAVQTGPSIDEATTLQSRVLELLKKLRGIDIETLKSSISLHTTHAYSSPSSVLISISSALRNISKIPEAETLDQIVEKVVDSKSFGGLGLGESTTAQTTDYENVLDLTEAWLSSLNAQDKPRNVYSTIASRSEKTRPMNLAQKIFAYHTIGGCSVEGLATGDVIRVAVDWILASELSWTVSFPRSPCVHTPEVDDSRECCRLMKSWALRKSGETTAFGLLATTSCILMS